MAHFMNNSSDDSGKEYRYYTKGKDYITFHVGFLTYYKWQIIKTSGITKILC